MPDHTRRGALRRVGLLLGAGLAGCLGGGGETPTADDPEDGVTPTETASPTPTTGVETRTAATETATAEPTEAATPLRATPAQDGVAWRVALDAGVGAAPTVADGTVYVGGWRETEGTPTPGGGTQPSDYLYALDAADGEESWRATVGPVQRQPRVVGDTVYVVRGYNGLHGAGYQVRALTTGGDEQWRHEAPRLKFLNVLGADQSGFVVGTQDDYLSGGEERVTDLRSDGSVRWNRRFVDVRGGTVTSGAVYASAHEGRVRAYDRDGGDERWTFDTTQTRPGDPVPVLGVVAVPGAKLWGLDQASGDTVWTVDREVRAVDTVQATLVGSAADGTLFAVGPTAGDVLWEQSLDADRAWIEPADGALYVGRSDGVLEARDPGDGQRRWHVEVGGRVRPVPAGDRVYAHRPEDGSAVAVAAADGTRQGSFDFEGGRSYLLAGDGADVAATEAGHVYGLAR